MTVFFDIDGVLADFVRGALAFHGVAIPIENVRWDFDKQIGITPQQFWDPLGRDFWATLPTLADGFALLRTVENMVGEARIGLLTAAAGTPGCIDGKRDWVKKYLPQYLPRMYTGTRKDLLASRTKLLIDDRDENCRDFQTGGGRAVLIPRPWNENRDQCRGGDFDVGSVAERVREHVYFTRLAS